MFHVRVTDGASQRTHGLSDHPDREDAAKAAVAYLEHGNPPPGTVAFVLDDGDKTVFTAVLTDDGKVSERKTQKTQDTNER